MPINEHGRTHIESDQDLIDWSKVEEAVELAVDIPAAERDVWITEFCKGDLVLKSEIKSLLTFEAEAMGFLEGSYDAHAAALLDESGRNKGRIFGNYQIVREIGHGGMGAVYLARRMDGEFTQRVALKIVRGSVSDSRMIERFRQERQILASLNHPNIAKLFDGGVSAEGEPFLVMEYVEGEAITDYVEQTNPPIEELLGLFVKVCSAVAYAHRSLVVHRDIKPGNILVNSEGEPKLLDFGLAKLTDDTTSDDKNQTETIFRALTPAYASPEQFLNRPITTASDIYSLGVLLYELLTGIRPFNFDKMPLDQIIATISATDPPPPSVAGTGGLMTVGKEKNRSKIKDQRSLRGDLDTIILMALRKEPERRYASVSEFADDIERYLRGIPIAARPHTPQYRAAKFIKRHRIGVAAAVIVLLAVMGGLAFSFIQATAARKQRDIAQTEKLKAEQVSQFLATALAFSDPSAAVSGKNNKRDATINDLLDEFAPRIEAELADQPEVRGLLQRTVGKAYFAQMRHSEGEKYSNQALATSIEVFGEEHEDTAAALVLLAEIKGSRGDYLAGRDMLERAVGIFRRRNVVDQSSLRELVNALNLLGSTQWTLGNYSGAEAAHREALSIATRINGDRRPQADSKLGLGGALYAKGRLDESIAMLRESIAELRSIPHMRWKLPEAMNLLAQVLTWKGAYDEALGILTDSEQTSLDIWGPNSSIRARSIYLRAYALCLKGDGREAEDALTEAERLFGEILSTNTLTMANILDIRNMIYTRTGRAKLGEPFGRRSVEMYEKAMIRGSAGITLARLHLSENLIAQKKLSEAESVLLHAYRDASEVQGPEHWRTLNVAHALADVYTAMGNPAEAAKYPERLGR